MKDSEAGARLQKEKNQAVGENSGRTTGGKTNLLQLPFLLLPNVLSSSYPGMGCREKMVCVSQWAAAQAQPHIFPMPAACPPKGSDAGLGWGNCWEDRQHPCASCRLPGPLWRQGREKHLLLGICRAQDSLCFLLRAEGRLCPDHWSDTQRLMMFYLCKALHHEPYFIASKQVIFLIQYRVQQSMHIIHRMGLKTRAQR